MLDQFNLANTKRELTAIYKRDKVKIITLFIIIEFYNLVLGLLNYTYIDDSFRQITGNTDFAISYSRWGSEITAWLIQGSRHLTDMGLTTHLLSGFILTLTSLILLYSLTGHLKWFSTLVSLFIGLNPWFLQNLSFRYDTVFMSLSLLFSVLPFLFWRKNKWFYSISLISIFIMCNYYQSSSSIYILTLLMFDLKDLLRGANLKNIFIKSLISALVYGLAMLLYKQESTYAVYLIQQPQVVEMASFDQLFSVFLNNLTEYYRLIMQQSANVWLVCFSLVFILFVFVAILTSSINKMMSFLYIIVYIVLSLILAYGVLLVFNTFWAGQNPRYAFGFAYLIALLLIYITDQKLTFSLMNGTRYVIISMFLFYLLSFPFVYFSTLDHQRQSFNNQTAVWLNNIKPYIKEDRRIIYTDYLFKNSPILLNSQRNYPILSDLVPDNKEIYWPNVQLIKTYGQIELNVEYMDMATVDFTRPEFHLVVDDYEYTIYVNDNQIFIQHKPDEPLYY